MYNLNFAAYISKAYLRNNLNGGLLFAKDISIKKGLKQQNISTHASECA